MRKKEPYKLLTSIKNLMGDRYHYTELELVRKVHTDLCNMETMLAPGTIP
jgi:hypothetical protein